MNPTRFMQTASPIEKMEIIIHHKLGPICTAGYRSLGWELHRGHRRGLEVSIYLTRDRKISQRYQLAALQHDLEDALFELEMCVKSRAYGKKQIMKNQMIEEGYRRIGQLMEQAKALRM